MRSKLMKSVFRTVVGLLLIGVVVGMALFVRAEWRMATRPKAIGWSEDTIRSQINVGMSRAEVLQLLGPPHEKVSQTDAYIYDNSYLSREGRHQSKLPSFFSITFENDKVGLRMTPYDY